MEKWKLGRVIETTGGGERGSRKYPVLETSIYDSDGTQVCTIRKVPKVKEKMLRNAKLISLAPEMRDTLKSLRGIEAWLGDAKIKRMFQDKVYSLLDKIDE